MSELIGKFEDAIRFAEQLIQQSVGAWSDCYGDYKISIGDAILDQELAKLERRRVFIADYLRESKLLSRYINFDGWEFNCLVSIGSFEMHNQAKELCWRSGHRLVTVPVPLANDSFCTNRCSNATGKPSYKCVFPYHTIVDTEILQNFPSSSNLLGLGEFVGLYSSILDYFEGRNTSPPSSLLTFIVDLFRDICGAYNSDYESFLKKVAVSLVFKCIIMRVNEDHQIGCGIDHLIAQVLEATLQMPHGKAVYWGVCLSIALFPEWASFGMDLHTLVSNGVGIGVISLEEMGQVSGLDLPFLIESAVKTRPKRTTVLSSVLEQKQRMEFLIDRLQGFEQLSAKH